MPKQSMDYSKTIIYKIVCNGLNVTDVYVGHTTNMVKRRCHHKHSCNNENGKAYNFKIYQTIRANGGWDNWNMIQICNFPCKNREEAQAEERCHYEMLNASLNTQYPCRSRAEYYEVNRDRMVEKKREWNEANKDKLVEMKREWYEANKDKLAEMKREWYEANKDKLAEKYTCCCGSTLRKVCKIRHEQTHKHLEYVKHNPLVVNTL